VTPANSGQFGDRHDGRSRRGDVIEAGEPCFRPDRRFERGEQRGDILERNRHRHDNHSGAASVRVVAQRIGDGAIYLRQAEQLVARRDVKRSDYRVEPGRRILDKRPVFAATTEKTGYAGCGIA
jgi:hypothetical protein